MITRSIARSILLISAVLVGCNQPVDNSIGSSGGQIASSDGNATLIIPPQAFSSSTTITIKTATSLPAASSGKGLVGGTAYTITAPRTPSKATTLRLRFNPASVDALHLAPLAQTNSLAIYQLVGSQWIRTEGSSVDPNTNTVSTLINQFGTFAVLASTVDSVAIDTPASTLEVGSGLQLVAHALDKQNNPISGLDFSWISSDPSIASIDSNGNVNALAAGSVTITASLEGQSASVTLTITLPKPAKIEISPTSATLLSGTTQQFTATAYNAQNQVIQGIGFSWNSSTPAVATINGSGLASAVAAGQSLITASAGGVSSPAAKLVVENPPAIQKFVATPASGQAPLSTTFSWQISGSLTPLTCQLDVNGDGTFDFTVTNCTSSSTQAHTYSAAGTYQAKLKVSSPSGRSAEQTISVAVTAGGPIPFKITFRVNGTLTTSQQNAFTNAADRWGKIITQTIGTVNNASVAANSCGGGFPAYSGVIKDVLIDLKITPIDGSGGILGQAGPCLVRTSNNLTLYGFMMFDSADVANLEQAGTLGVVILHEMGHVLGIGSLWDFNRSLLVGGGTGSQCGTDPVFVGANAVREWQTLGGTGSVPVEGSTSGAGSCDSHWRESVFKSELMTPYLGPGTINPVSRVTIGSLQDLGYSVDYTAADSFVLPAIQSQQLQPPSLDGLRMLPVDPSTFETVDDRR